MLEHFVKKNLSTKKLLKEIFFQEMSKNLSPKKLSEENVAKKICQQKNCQQNFAKKTQKNLNPKRNLSKKLVKKLSTLAKRICHTYNYRYTINIIMWCRELERFYPSEKRLTCL